jgi:hypothetical protein
MNAIRQILFLLFFLMNCVLSLQAQILPQEKFTTIPSHPRILLLAGEEKQIQASIEADSTWKKLHLGILEECDRIVATQPVQRIQIGRRLLDKSRECLRRMFYLSYAYRLTKQQKYLKRAETELLAVAAFSDWNPSHFLDVGEMTMAVAIGYDWLHEVLPESSRNTIKEAILKKGIEPSLDSKYNSWLKASHNWNQVCNAGITYGALAIFEDYPQLAQQMINRSIESIVLPLKDYEPDGAYPEGYSYWGYGTSFQVMFNSAIERVFGNKNGLAHHPGFMKTASYLLHMNGASGNSFNYSDAGSEKGLQPAMFWFAQKLKDPSLLWVEKQEMLNGDSHTNLKNRLLPAMLLWGYQIQLKDIPEPKSKMWVGKGKNPVALMRTSWTDPHAIYVGFKTGSPSVNHGHMDVGSFIMEANGERWAMDFGMQNYESLESKGINIWGKEQQAQRWEVFRYNNFTHNTLTVNNALQLVNGYATITSSSAKPSSLYAITDLTSVYKTQLKAVQRGISIIDQKYVAIRDEIETGDSSSIVRWTMLTSAEARINSKGIIELSKNGKKLHLQVQSQAKVSLKTWPTDPPKPYDAPNPGTVLVGFEVEIPKHSRESLTVLLIPQNNTIKASKQIMPLENWGRSVVE